MLAILAAACATGPALIAGPTPTSTVRAAAHAPEIRLALIGQVTDHNVWALFAGADYSYNSYAVRAQYWPRLYAASIPDQAFEPLAASGLPAGMHQEGIFHTATVPVRTELQWTDATPFTAQDVAFTVNTTLRFQLGFDWHDYYDPEILDHAEAVAPDTVEFFFQRAPGVDVWQYGALQGPLVQQRFWASKVAVAAQSLPPDELHANIDALSARIVTLQEEVNKLYAATLAAQGQQARALQADLRRQQGNLDEASNDLAEAETELQQAMHAARLALFEQDDSGEPLLGAWLPAETSSDSAAEATIVNIPNPGFPGPVPNFDRAVYNTYETSDAATRALADGEVNLILDLRPDASGSSTAAMTSPTRSMRFLLFNLGSPGLGDASLRRALACLIDQDELAGLLGDAAPLRSFVPQAESTWHNAEARLPCAGLEAASRVAQAVEILKAGGYTWQQEPSAAESGAGLNGPDGTEVPRMQLLAPVSDESRTAAAAYVEQRGLMLGIPLSMQSVAADALDYAVLSSYDYDMAVVGWRLSPYPGYLCDWFNAEGVFNYHPTSVISLCGELAVTSDLDRARGLVLDLQGALGEDVPMVPLFSTVTHDSFRGIAYPFAAVLDGLTGAYGAPELAFPAEP